MYEALRGVIFTAIPTPENLTGKAHPDEAHRRLSRLGDALGAFPDRRITPDPFVRPKGMVRIRTVRGTSCHDAIVRLAGRLYDSLGEVVAARPGDPEPEKHFAGCYYDNQIEYETEIEYLGKPMRLTVRGLGTPRAAHFTEFRWTPGLWDSLFNRFSREFQSWWATKEFNPHPGRLRIKLDQEVSLWFAKARRRSKNAPPDPEDYGEFNGLMAAATQASVKGDGLTIIRAICRGRGQAPLANLATLCRWSAPYEGTWNSARGRLNKKLKTHRWKLSTHNGEAVAARIKPTARK